MNRGSSLQELKAGGISEVVSWGWDAVRLVDELERIDYQVIDDLRPEDEGETVSWARIRFKHPETWRILYKTPGKVEGYWSFVPLFKEGFELLKEGRIAEGQISEDMIPEAGVKGCFEMFFTMIALNAEYRGGIGIEMLYSSFLEVVGKLASEGVFFEEAAANAYTPAGVSICKSFGLKHVADAPYRGQIYAGKFSTLLAMMAQNRNEYPRELYNAKFGKTH
ncbi:hypothetical protein B2A_10416 [mine drainage metagenome]|uniref:N-acetyltransferase domain-containing protein n=1 Tax=mine drainage metagenome TaxID=410659 RepID=T0Z2T4_9ZZZZ